MRGGVGTRLANPNCLTTLIGSLVHRTPQLSHFSSGAGKPVGEEEIPQIQEDSESDDDKEAIKERISKYPWACPYPDIVCTREQREELARIAKTVPESAPGVAKRYADYVARSLQRTDAWDFEEKIRIMHKIIEEVSQGYK